LIPGFARTAKLIRARLPESARPLIGLVCAVAALPLFRSRFTTPRHGLKTNSTARILPSSLGEPQTVSAGAEIDLARALRESEFPLQFHFVGWIAALSCWIAFGYRPRVDSRTCIGDRKRVCATRAQPFSFLMPWPTEPLTHLAPLFGIGPEVDLAGALKGRRALLVWEFPYC